ncbi:hypothetical protein [Sediminibacter sp. Hel_I_10]|uniref:hypothetical protein n=1 Tax=Sediminibacter sp. Hel_I_10 TaxID=1392490 RepID=UPI00047AC4DB|nr:hypothetical protein [Sediminibacter sp. Hel_I_10]
MKKYFKYILAFSFPIIVFNCETDEAVQSELSNFVGFEISNPMRVTVGNNETETYSVDVYASETSSADRTYNLIVDTEASTLGAPYTVPSSVTIPAGSNMGTFDVVVTDDEYLQFEVQSILINFEKEAGVDFSAPFRLNITESCLDTIATFTLTLDTWPDETTWELYDLSGTPVLIGSGGPYVNPDDDFAVLSFDFCLSSGDYGIVVYDSYGDGIADGGYTISVGDDVLVSGVVPGAQSTAEFVID